MKKSPELAKVLATLNPSVIQARKRIITGVFNDSRNVCVDSVFVAIKGERFDGHCYIDAAVNRGAGVVVCQELPSSPDPAVTYITTRDSYHAYALLCEWFLDYPATRLELIGITGTNGKTSSAFLTRQLLKAAGLNCGLISTVEYAYGETVLDAERTTPEAYELQSLFTLMAERRCSHVVMEVSSHALAQHRPGSAKFAGAVFTNLTGDHLDYHGDMEGYFAAKTRLFEEYLADSGVMTINVDDEFGQRLVERFRDQRCFGFGKSGHPFCEILDVTSDIAGSDLSLAIAGKSYRFRTNLIGTHNAYNIAGVLALTTAMGFEPEQMIEVLEQTDLAIPGRLEGYKTQKGVRIFIDYAHTDDALEKVLTNLRPLSPQNLTVVFGCGGDRDRTKRPRMGAAAAKFADSIVLTNDNPRGEEPDSIIRDIQVGIPEDAKVVVIPDRAEAIRMAVSGSRGGDVVLIAGKGHETYQIIGDRTLDFSDCEEVGKLLNGE